MASNDEPIPMPFLENPCVTPALARSARDHFQPLYATRQTEDDGLEMATNTIGAFGIIAEWRAKKRAAQSSSIAPPNPSVEPESRVSSMSNQE